MSVRVTHTLDALVRDLEAIGPAEIRKGTALVRDRARAGNRWAQNDARRTAGEVGRNYPDAFAAEVTAIGAGNYEAAYGPDANHAGGQGGMKFEHGEGNQTAPHLNLNKSADIHGPLLAGDVRKMLDDLFWLGS